MRIYLPGTVADLTSYPDTALEAAVAFAATSGLAAALPDEDEEAVEFSAFLAAAETSLELLVGARTAGREVAPRRVIITADVAEVRVGSARAHGHPGAIVVDGAIAWADVASVHLDDPEAAQDVEAAIAGDEAASERLIERDLLWYDASELASLVTELP